ncbi:MAG TPA: PQQ-dependent sugar dehydrogenase [Urbifossiella sp.]|nr:PQQ-dependent sugar dehydrogenase [Urbifossiella sp.]
MLRYLAVSMAVAAFALMLSTAAQEPKPTAKKAPEVRKQWTTSKITGSPEPPPPYKAARAFPNVKFNHPLLIARCPGSERLFVGEQDGAIYSIANKPDARAELFFDLKKEIKTLGKHPGTKGTGDMYGLVFHPKFAQNRYCYVCYTLTAKDPKVSHLPDGTRVSRFKVSNTDPPRIDPASEEIVITFQGGGHNGGDLHFSPIDGMLYVSTGDGRGPNPPDLLNTGQDCSDLLSSILRIDVDKRDPGKNHAVPKDNPFVGMKDVRPEIWAFGFRNPWRMSFDQKGQLWVGDVGWELWEMVHRVEKGGNYGWSIMEARQPVKPNQKPGPTPIRPPLIELPHTIAASITGGYVYRGKKFPELVGAYVFGDWETRRIWAARVDGDRVTAMPEIVKPSVRPSAFGEDNAGELYFLDYDNGMIFTLAHNDAAAQNANFPKKLSETGLFKDVKKHEMEDGVIEYRPNVRQWQDGWQSWHYLAQPGISSVKLFDKPRKLPGQVYWHEFKMQYPKDSVLVKSILRERNKGGLEFIETQILHHDGEDWRGYSYRWRDDQSDADLVAADGDEKDYIDEPAPMVQGVKRPARWAFHSRTQCLTCHNAWAEYALSFRPEQLDDSQLISFSRQGVLKRIADDDTEKPPFDAKSAAKRPRLFDEYFPRDEKGDEAVARSYLHVNCAHCHRFGGGGGQVVLELDFSKPLKETGLLNARPRQGDFAIPDARLIAPGDPYRSVLYYRMCKFGAGRMPHLGSEKPDVSALKSIRNWILDLDKAEKAKHKVGEITVALKSPRSAMPFAESGGIFGHMTGDGGDRWMKRLRGEWEKALADAAKLPPGPVRDLFEGYLPPDPKGRKLGANPRPGSILAKTGNAKNGETLFFNKDNKCVNCHKLGDKGVSFGPDLANIGSQRSRAEILDSILNPSAKVDPKFASYLVKTHDGRGFTGLMSKRDEKQLLLRDAENKEIAIAADNVEAVQPSRLSLMPDGLAAGLTPQEAADLLEFLVNLKKGGGQ